MYAEGYRAVSDYVLMYDELKKVVPNEVNIFEEKVDEILVALKMMGYSNLKMKNILEYMATEEEQSDLESEVDEDDFEVIEERLSELFDKIEDVEKKFAELTGINISKSYSKVDGYFYYEMEFSDVVRLTPQAEKLKSSGISFGLQTWVDEW
jgi:hypothetical protein